MNKVLIKILILIGLLTVLLFLYIKHLEKKSIFFPYREIEATPKEIGLDFEDIYIKTSDNKLINAWFIPHPDSEKVILFFHGNAGNISYRLDKIQYLYQLGVDVFIIDYRGYGNSQGKPTEKGVYLDAKAGYKHLLKKKNISPQDIIIYGESLGSVVGIDLASSFKVGGLIIAGGFSSGPDIGKLIYPYIPKFLFPNILNSLNKIKKVRVKKLFIHSKEDEIVPISLADKLYQAAGEPKEFITTQGGHNYGLLACEGRCLKRLESFLGQ